MNNLLNLIFDSSNIVQIIIAVVGFLGVGLAYLKGRGDGKVKGARQVSDAAIAVYRRKDKENENNIKVANKIKKGADEILDDPNSGFDN